MTKCLSILFLVCGCAEDFTASEHDLGGALATGGALGVGGATVRAFGGNPVGGATQALAANGGAPVSFGGAAVGSSTTVAAVPACLSTIKDGCYCAAAYRSPDIAGWLESCEEALGCLRQHNCGPYDACATGSGVCVVTTGSQAVQMAKETYDCSCGTGA